LWGGHLLRKRRDENIETRGSGGEARKWPLDTILKKREGAEIPNYWEKKKTSPPLREEPERGSQLKWSCGSGFLIKENSGATSEPVGEANIWEKKS